MYLDIDPKQKNIPQIISKKKSNVVKKNEMCIFNEVLSLLKYIKDTSIKYQGTLEGKVEELYLIKEREFTCYLDLLYKEHEKLCAEQMEKKIEKATNLLNSLLLKQEGDLKSLGQNLKESLTKTVKQRLDNLCKDETLINYLVDMLHNEFNDAEKKIKIKHVIDDKFIELVIENEDCILSVDTRTLIQELKNCISQL